MDLDTKPDFPEALRRFEAWWDGEIVDRPPVTLHVKRDRPPSRTPPPKQHDTLREKWLDVEYKLDCFEASLDGAVFLAETFPAFWPNLGPEVCSALFGCELKFSERSSWSIPAAESCREIADIQPDFENTYWRTILDATDLSIERGRGRWITALTDLHTNGDLLAALRDPQNLCLDLADDLDAVRAACDHVTTFYPRIHDDLWSRIAAAGQPCTTWLPTLHAGRSYATNCDFICMISPEMFQRTILPGIVEEMRYLERNIFHLDGPGALKHLDALLAQEELDAVQWVFGAGHGPAAAWPDVYQKIQAAGKSMQIPAEDLDDARAVMEHIRPEGAWFTIGGAHDRPAAEAFLRDTERWAAGKR